MTKIPGGWRYLDGSEWPSLNAMRDHLLHVSHSEVKGEQLAAAVSRPALAEGEAA